MKTLLRAAIALGAAAVAAGALAAARPADGPAAAADGLAVRDGSRWVTFWRRASSPARWNGSAPLAERVAWRSGADGVEWGEVVLRGASEAWRTRVVMARLDPRKVELSLA